MSISHPQEKYLRVIQQVFPGQRWLDAFCEINDTGQYNDILVINKEFIFRFPKYPQFLAQLKVEACLLNSLRKKLPLEIPNPLFENLAGVQVGEAFLGYRMIPGEPLWREILEKLNYEPLLDKLAIQLGAFLKALHSIPITDIHCKLSRLDTHEEILDIYTHIRKNLFPLMRNDARLWAASHFETHLDKQKNFEYEPVLKHGDFGPSNILFDDQHQTITGIIDFGGAGIGDPAYDFAGLLSGYGEAFLKRCAKAYPEVEDMLDRIHFYQGTFALLEALYGFENNDQQAFEDGIGMYR
jgi:aminoglycoside 2''-phosphotransferase